MDLTIGQALFFEGINPILDDLFESFDPRCTLSLCQFNDLRVFAFFVATKLNAGLYCVMLAWLA